MADINLSAEQVAALILSIGDKSKLKTTKKNTLVDAINSAISDAGLQDEVFIVTADFDNVNMTISNADHTFAEIAAAYDAKKIVFLRAGSYEFEATAKVSSVVQFSAPFGSITYTAIVRDTGVWTASKIEKVNEITDSATNNQYPSAKAVADYVESHGGTPLYIRGTRADDTFIPETDYTVQEINDAFTAGRYVAVVVNDEYIVPLVCINNLYAEFNLSKADPRDFSTYVYINVVRTLSGWEIVFDEN